MAGFQDFLRNNSNALLQSGVGLLSGQTAQEQAAKGFAGFAQGRQQNKTMEWLQSTDPELAQAVGQGILPAGDAFKLAYQRKLEAAKPKNNFMSVGKNLYNIETGDWISPPAGVAAADEEWGLNPVWGRDAEGKTVLGQVSKSGKFKPLETGGFIPTPGISNLDLGTSILTLDNRSGMPVAQNQKDLAGAEQQKVVGKQEGEAIAAAPSDLQAAVNAKGLIESLKNDPNRVRGTGKSSIFNSIPASRGYDFQKKVNQATSGAFLSAIDQLRGMGALSNAEGQTAKEAVARIDTATSETEFLNALAAYEQIVDQAIARAQSRMGDRTLKGPQPNATPDPLGIR